MKIFYLVILFILSYSFATIANTYLSDELKNLKKEIEKNDSKIDRYQNLIFSKKYFKNTLLKIKTEEKLLNSDKH